MRTARESLMFRCTERNSSMAQEVVLFTDGQDTTPNQIVEAWEMLREKVKWFPRWFAAEIVQDIMYYLGDRTSASQITNVLRLRTAVGGGARCHVEVVESIDGDRRVFVGPLGCVGMPNADGGINFHWRPSTESEPKKMVMTIY